MAGIGIKLNRIFEKKTIGMNLVGYAYSVNATIMPMFVVIGNIMLMNFVFDTATESYASRELFACTILYTFIFGLLSCSPWNAVISRYLSDVIFEERYEDIMPCYHMGLTVNIALAALMGMPFCIHEWLVGGVVPWYVFTGYFGFVCLVLVFYSMIFLSICKDYGKISLFFLLGMLAGFVLAAVLIFLVHWDKMYSMLCGMAVGFLVTGVLEAALIRSYFRVSSRSYKPLLRYFRDYWQLVLGNFLYTLGLYAHNFVFWTSAMRIVVVKSFVCCEPYDMATCLAMFTNLSASTIFISLIEMHFHNRYREYFNAVIGGSLHQIEKAKSRLFRSITSETMGIARIQFIISVVAYLFFVLLAPLFGMGSLVMQIYPLLAAGYYTVFLMYAFIILLYYFSDHAGLLLTTGVFAVVTTVASFPCRELPSEWYGLGLWIGAFAGWLVSYARLKWVEKNLDANTFCKGELIERGHGPLPSAMVYDARGGSTGGKRKRVLFVINTMSRAGAEMALLAMLNELKDPLLQIDLFVLMDQGELIPYVPNHVHVLNESPSLKSVLSPDGQNALRKTVIKRLLSHGTVFKSQGYLLTNYRAMKRSGRLQTEKLLWRCMSDGAPVFDTEYDLAVAYLEGGSAYYVADHVKAKKKAAWIHVDYADSGYTRDLDEGCYNAFDRIFCVAQETRDKFIQEYPGLAERTDIFENMLDRESILGKASLPGGFTDGYDGQRILTVGRLNPQKGYDVAIQAMALLKERGVHARWYVLGEGAERPALEKQIAEAGLREDFVLAGAVDNPYPYYAQCDLYVHATRYEGKSIAIREAQTLGKAIVASDCSGNREEVNHRVDGILCAFDPVAIADAVQRMLENPKLRERYGEAARARAAQETSDLYKFYALLSTEDTTYTTGGPVATRGRTYAGQDFGQAPVERLDEFELDRAFAHELERQTSSSAGKSHYEET